MKHLTEERLASAGPLLEALRDRLIQGGSLEINEFEDELRRIWEIDRRLLREVMREMFLHDRYGLIAAHSMRAREEARAAFWKRAFSSEPIEDVSVVPTEAERQIFAGYLLGVRVADHIRGIRTGLTKEATRRRLETLRAVARGDFTLTDTPEEVAAELRLPDGSGGEVAPFVRETRERERTTAEAILRIVNSEQG